MKKIISSKIFLVVILPLLSLVLALPALAQEERIIEFQSDITINSDSSLLVTETITVEALGQEIKRGIYRDFPTIYKDGFFQSQVGFEVVSVRRNGADIEYSTEKRSNGIRVYLGDMSVYIPEGIYTYELTYLTTGQLGYFEEHDELYWNVTGNGWIFPIEKASALVHLPAGVSTDQLRIDGYTGLAGSQAKYYKYEFRDNSLYYETTFGLYANEGLTIVVGWPKGFVTQPTQSEKNTSFFFQNLGLIIALIGLVIVLLYYLFAWNKVGRDPSKQAIIPHYESPRGFSPALMGYVYKMGYFPQLLTSALIKLAIKGYLKIEKNSNDNYKLIKLTSDDSLLSEEEKSLVEELFAENDSLMIQSYNHQKISLAGRELKKSLIKQCGKKYFNYNFGYLAVGIVLSIIFIALSLISVNVFMVPFTGFILLWLSIWTIGVVTLAVTVFVVWKTFLSDRSLKNFGGAIFLSLFTLPFFGGEVVGIFMLSTVVPFLQIILLILFFVINAVFLFLLIAPTIEGRKIMDEIKGFKWFLSVTEKDRMNFHNPPEKTPELFEKFLPYAVALNVQNKWAEQFSQVFSQLHEQGRDYHPGWYAGALTGASIVAFSNSLGTGLNSAITSASVAPGSSSGFGGGGGSGGGGGGGGGGGF